VRWEAVEALIRQATFDGIIEVECPVCGSLIRAEPDAKGFHCEACEKIVMRNPMIEFGLI